MNDFPDSKEILAVQKLFYMTLYKVSEEEADKLSRQCGDVLYRMYLMDRLNNSFRWVLRFKMQNDPAILQAMTRLVGKFAEPMGGVH